MRPSRGTANHAGSLRSSKIRNSKQQFTLSESECSATSVQLADLIDVNLTTCQTLPPTSFALVLTGGAGAPTIAFGNTFNGNINDLQNTSQPPAVLDALFNASDHLPVVADYQIPARMDVNVGSLPTRVIVGAAVPINVTVTNTAPVSVAVGADELDYSVIEERFMKPSFLTTQCDASAFSG